MGLLVLQKNIVLLLITVTAIFSSLLGPALSFDFAFATSEEEEGHNDGGGDDDNDGEEGGDQPKSEPEPEQNQV